MKYFGNGGPLSNTINRAIAMIRKIENKDVNPDNPSFEIDSQSWMTLLQETGKSGVIFNSEAEFVWPSDFGPIKFYIFQGPSSSDEHKIARGELADLEAQAQELRSKISIAHAKEYKLRPYAACANIDNEEEETLEIVF